MTAPARRRRLPPLNSLFAFEAVGRHLNMSRAAEELGVTYSAVSHQMRTLEAHFNVPLFAARGPSPVAFARPNDRFRWMNIFDKDDILGWPIRPLGGDFQAIWITDHQENTGGPLRSHTNYWFDFGVNDRIATAIRWL